MHSGILAIMYGQLWSMAHSRFAGRPDYRAKSIQKGLVQATTSPALLHSALSTRIPRIAWHCTILVIIKSDFLEIQLYHMKPIAKNRTLYIPIMLPPTPLTPNNTTYSCTSFITREIAYADTVIVAPLSNISIIHPAI